MKRFIIAGGGAAALEAARAIRAQSETDEILLFLKEGLLPYSRPALTELLRGEKDVNSILARPAAYYEQQRIQTYFEPVTEIHPASHAITAPSGRYEYSSLLLATGADCFNPLTGEGVPLYTLRTYADLQALRLAAKANARAVVVGGGILGLEAALALRERGCAVTVLERGPRLMAVQTDQRAAELLTISLHALGLQTYCNAGVNGVLPGGLSTTLGDMAADFILVSAGIRAEMGLALRAGIPCDKGIVVNAAMQAEAPDVFAAGDCAQFAGRLAGLWPVAGAQGKTAGQNMAGNLALFTPLPAATVFKGGSVRLFSAGSLTGEAQTTENNGNYQAVYTENGSITGVLLLGSMQKMAMATKLIGKPAETAQAFLAG